MWKLKELECQYVITINFFLVMIRVEKDPREKKKFMFLLFIRSNKLERNHCGLSWPPQNHSGYHD